MNMFKWLETFLGTKDKAQIERTQEVADIVHQKKNEFTSDMLKLQEQSRKVHQKTMQAQDEAVKLKEIVDDVAAKIAVATGSLEL